MNTYQDMSEQEIWNELVNFFGNKYAAAAVLGNFENEGGTTGSITVENNRRSRALGMSNVEYTQAVDSGAYDAKSFVGDGIGYGMAQWTGSRKQKLLDFAKANNSSVGSAKLQVAFLEKELVDYENQQGYTILSDMKRAGSVDEASEIFMIRYEDCGTKTSENIKSRANDSRKYYEKYAGTSVDKNGTLFDSFNAGSLEEQLSDVTIDIQIDSLNEICASWNQSVAGVDIASVPVAQTFLPLTQCGVAVSYIPSLENALKQTASLVASVSNIIKTTGDEQVVVDDNSQKQTGAFTNNGGGYRYGGGGSSGSVSGSNPTTSTNNSNANLGINTNMVNAIKGLDFNSYVSFMTALSSIVTDKVSLTTYFSNTAYADILKKALLNINSLPNNLKTIIADMDPRVLQATLYSIITDGSVVTDISKSVMYNHLEELASKSNLSMSELLKNQSSLVKIFTDFGNTSRVVNDVILGDNMADNLVNIYDGNAIQGMNSDDVNLIRGFVDVIAEEKNITAEALLNDSSNSSYLNKSFQEIGKAYQYMTNVGYTDLNTASSVLNSIFLKS